MEDTEFCIVLSTTSTKDEASRIAAALIDKRLAGCVQIDGPVESHYFWEGAAEKDEEWRLTIKTRRECLEKLEALVLQIHSYDVPQLVVLPVIGGSAGYLGWVRQQTG